MRNVEIEVQMIIINWKHIQYDASIYLAKMKDRILNQSRNKESYLFAYY